MGQVQGKVALVTGTSPNIGGGIAEALTASASDTGLVIAGTALLCVGLLFKIVHPDQVKDLIVSPKTFHQFLCACRFDANAHIPCPKNGSSIQFFNGMHDLRQPAN